VVANQLRALGMIVAVIMGIGAVFAAMNTMYASVSARTTEIGTLRALGFRPGAVMGSFLLESLALALAAGIIGVILAFPVNGFSTTFGNFLTFSTMTFAFRVTDRSIASTDIRSRHGCDRRLAFRATSHEDASGRDA
jgi:putative ABC transport system permease protein